jgi:uncharacterized protein YbjQ (UPF0145 family)
MAAALIVPTVSHANAWSDASLPVFTVSTATPPVQQVVAKLNAKVCRATPDNDAQAAAISSLQRKAAAVGATALVNVSYTMETSRFAYIKNGFPNPCRFETDAKGSAVILAAGAPG